MGASGLVHPKPQKHQWVPMQEPSCNKAEPPVGPVENVLRASGDAPGRTGDRGDAQPAALRRLPGAVLPVQEL